MKFVKFEIKKFLSFISIYFTLFLFSYLFFSKTLETNVQYIYLCKKQIIDINYRYKLYNKEDI